MNRLASLILIAFAPLLWAGCNSPVDPTTWSMPSIGGGGSVGEPKAEPTPMETASRTSVRVGTFLLIGGILFSVLIRGSGWGLSLAAAGIICILMGWLFDQWWAPWLGAASVVAYAVHKIYNRLDPNQETEPLLS